MHILLKLLLFFMLSVAATAHGQTEAVKALLARAKALELNTPYVPPPGDPLEHHASGYAKIMCSAVFVTGLDPAFAAENVGYFTAPYADRAKLGTPGSTAKSARCRSPCPTVLSARRSGSVVRGA